MDDQRGYGRVGIGLVLMTNNHYRVVSTPVMRRQRQLPVRYDWRHDTAVTHVETVRVKPTVGGRFATYAACAAERHGKFLRISARNVIDSRFGIIADAITECERNAWAAVRGSGGRSNAADYWVEVIELLHAKATSPEVSIAPKLEGYDRVGVGPCPDVTVGWLLIQRPQDLCAMYRSKAIDLCDSMVEQLQGLYPQWWD